MRCTDSGCTSWGKHEQDLIAEDNPCKPVRSDIASCRVIFGFQTRIWHIWSVANRLRKVVPTFLVVLVSLPRAWFDSHRSRKVLRGWAGSWGGYPGGWEPGARVMYTAWGKGVGLNWDKSENLSLEANKHSRAKLSITSLTSQGQWPCVRARCGVYHLVILQGFLHSLCAWRAFFVLSCLCHLPKC